VVGGRAEGGLPKREGWTEPVGDQLAEPRFKRGHIAWTSTGEKGEASCAIAMTDTNSMTGIVEFYEAAQAAGVKPILGVELTQPLAHEREMIRRRVGEISIPSEKDEKEDIAWRGEGSQSPPLCHGDLSKRVVLLARDLEGYHELCELTTRRMLEADFDLLSVVPAVSDHVVVLSDWCEALAAAHGREKELTHGLIVPGRSRRARNRAVYESCQRLGLECAVSGDVRMANAEDVTLLALLHAMRQLTTVPRVVERGDIPNGEGRLLRAEEIAERFALGRGHALENDLRQAMENTVRIAQMCDCRLPLREWKFPRFGGGDGNARLRGLAHEGLRWRYGNNPPAEAVVRLEHELEIIARLGFSDYFLLVHRIVEEARRRGFFTLGRGSAANSIVTYVLGISHVCPLRHGLHFERFLNPERSSPPDIDLDFSWRERDEMLHWCFEFFGHDQVALISTIQTLRLRQAVREVGKAWGLAPEEINAFNRLKSVGFVLEEMESGEGRGGRRLRHLALEEPWRTILAQAQRLAGMPRHLSIHCGGIVIASERLCRWVPLTHSAKGFVITQMDMVGVEELGLVKMDLLSNRSLGVLKDALMAAELHEGEIRQEEREGDNKRELEASLPYVPPRAQAVGSGGSNNNGETFLEGGKGERARVLAHEAARMKLAGTRRGTSVALAGLLETFENSGQHGESLSRPRRVREILFDLEALTRDRATRALIHEGRTMGCFYIESPGMRALFERLRCKEFTEVVAASSIIRPGVAESGMMEEYIARHRGRARETQHFARVQELLRKLLPETYGVMVYQEDVLLVAHEVAGMSYGEADVLRRAMSGKTRSGEAMEAARERFVRGAMERQGLTEDEAQEIWRQVASFAGYSFCKGHSAAFAVLSYQVAYLKAHYPAEFFAAVLDNGGGFYGAGAYLEEARRWGLTTLPPCVNEGDVHFRGETERTDYLRAKGWVRVGLSAVSEVSRETCDRIVQEREHGGPYRSLMDFLRRVRPEPHEARQLARAGAMDGLMGEPTSGMGSFRERCYRRQRVLLELEILIKNYAPKENGELQVGLHEKECSDRQGPPIPVAVPISEQKAKARLCRWEMETMGFMVSGHPLDFVARPPHTIAARDIRRYAGRQVQMVGWAIAAKELAASNSGRPMKMLTLEDRTDTFEVVLFPDAYARFAPRTLSCGPYLVRGRVDMRLGSPTLEARELEVIPLEWE
ncbi:MAG: PHP domain-containing protein, partial [Candidatus Sumerlaeaceae bacterium]|nr:PHP domain-containing protein [Candidatus Sumerlaeaceae bacterium]